MNGIGSPSKVAALAGLLVCTAITASAQTVASPPAQMQDTCRQALALGLDVSGSVNADEYRLQLDGLAAALGSPAVVDALLGQPGAPVRLFVFEWSTPGEERILLPWTEVTDVVALSNVQATLTQTQRAPMQPSTGLGRAIEFGADALAGQTLCWRRTLDISGDGKSNTGPRPETLDALPAWLTVNGLAVGSDDARAGDQREVQIAELAAYYLANVVSGPEAFVETAIGFRDFEAAMERKLLRELATIAVSKVSPWHQ